MPPGPTFVSMATTLSYRIAGAWKWRNRWGQGLRALALAALFAAAPFAAREAVAQRPAGIRVAAFVSAPASSVAFHADTANPAPPPAGVLRLGVAGVGVLDVQSGPGAAIRVADLPAPAPGGERTASDPMSPTWHVIRITIDYVGS